MNEEQVAIIKTDNPFNSILFPNMATGPLPFSQFSK